MSRDPIMRRVVVVLGAVVFVDALFYAALAPLLPVYADRFRLSEAEAGVLVATYGAGTLLAALPAGWLAVRVGARTTVVCGLALLSAGSLAFAFPGGAVGLDLARFVQGVGGSCAWVGALAWLIRTGPAERRGELVGTALAVGIAGAMAGPVVGALAVAIGPEPVFVAASVAACALAGWATRAPKPRDEPERGRRPMALWRSTDVWVGLWFIGLAALLAGLLGLLVPLRLANLGAGAAAIAATFLIAAAVEAVTSPLGGRLADRLGRLPPLRLSVGLGALVTALLPWPSQAWLLALLVIAVSAAFGLLWAPAMALISDRFETGGDGLAAPVALAGTAFAAGQLLGSALGGSLAAATNDAAPYIVIAALCLTTWLTATVAGGRGPAQPDRSRAPGGRPLPS